MCTWVTIKKNIAIGFVIIQFHIGDTVRLFLLEYKESLHRRRLVGQLGALATIGR